MSVEIANCSKSLAKGSTVWSVRGGVKCYVTVRCTVTGCWWSGVEKKIALGSMPLSAHNLDQPRRRALNVMVTSCADLASHC